MPLSYGQTRYLILNVMQREGGKTNVVIWGSKNKLLPETVSFTNGRHNYRIFYIPYFIRDTVLFFKKLFNSNKIKLAK